MKQVVSFSMATLPQKQRFKRNQAVKLEITMKKLTLSFLVLATLLVEFAKAQDTLIGTFTVNYRYNAAGQFTDQSNPDYTKANPYFGNSIPPGPIFIDAAPGHYRLVVVSGSGCGVWSGDANSGRFLVTGHNPSEIVQFDHAFGQIALYYWDWVAFDNDPSVQTTVSVYQVQDGPRVAFSPLPFAFGRVALDGSQKTLFISNEGGQDLIGSVSLAPGASIFSIESGGGNFVLSPGQTLDVVINFTPPPTGTTFAEDLVVTSNDPVNGNQVIPISGELYYKKQSRCNGRFGQFYYHDEDGIVEIEIDPRWVEQNIIAVYLPTIGRTVWCHQAAAASFQVAFIIIESKNLQNLIHTYDGLFVPRYQRAEPGHPPLPHEPRYLSNHSWGTAIDLNHDSNHLGNRPSEEARVLWNEAFKQVGSMMTGLPGFKWGGEFGDGRADGGHFEVLPGARCLP